MPASVYPNGFWAALDLMLVALLLAAILLPASGYLVYARTASQDAAYSQQRLSAVLQAAHLAQASSSRPAGGPYFQSGQFDAPSFLEFESRLPSVRAKLRQPTLWVSISAPNLQANEQVCVPRLMKRGAPGVPIQTIWACIS